MATDRNLPEKRRKFVKEYLIDLNATRAAIRAGYSPDTAYSEGNRLLKDVEVKDLLAKEQARLARKTEVTQEQVVRELSMIAFSNMGNYTRLDGGKYLLDMSSCDREHMAAVQELTEDTTGGSGDGKRELVIRTKIKLSDKTKALELLSRHLGMLHDKTEHSGKVDLTRMSDEDLRKELASLIGTGQ